MSSNLTGTDEQMATAHPYEDQFERGTAWLFENLYWGFRQTAPNQKDFDSMVEHRFGEMLINIGESGLAVCWNAFVQRKRSEQWGLQHDTAPVGVS